MKRYVLRRLLLMVPIMLGVSLIVFVIMSLLPGDPGRMILGMGAKVEDVAEYNRRLGIDQPFFKRLWDYIWGILHGDFGLSYRSLTPVADEIRLRFPYSVRLAIAGSLVAYLLGIPLGLLAAVRQNSMADLSTTVASMIFACIPEFWLGLMLILLFSLYLRILPTGGVDSFRSYIMPVIVLALPQAATTSRLTRASMLDCIGQDYIRTAKAKGMSNAIVIWKHTLKNAMIPIISTLITTFGVSLGGTVVVENIFSIPGIGSLMVEAIKSKDVPVVMSITILLSLLYCIFILIADLAVAGLDPRIRRVFVKE